MKYLRSYEDTENTSEEYETQYFGFGRSFLKQTLSLMVESELHSNIETAKQNFFKKDLDEDIKIKVIEKCSTLLQFVLKKSEISFEKLHEDFDKHFCIPDNVLLPQDELFKGNVDECKIEDLKVELDRLKSDILALDAPQVVMESELNKIATIKKHLVAKEQQLFNTVNELKETLFKDDVDIEL